METGSETVATNFDFLLHVQYNELNAALFNNILPSLKARNFKLMFKRGMTRSLGRCKWKQKYVAPAGQREYAITIADKLMHEPIRNRQVLLHEMIHLYMYITDGDSANAGHGPRWQQKWIEIGKAHDVHFGTTYMEKHARSQCTGQYANCKEKQKFSVPSAANTPRPAATLLTKWTLTCPECGHVHPAKALNGRIVKRAITTDEVIHGKNGCKHRMIAKRNW